MRLHADSAVRAVHHQMILSNAHITGVQDQIRAGALLSFEFFANSVLACDIESDVCAGVQEFLEDCQKSGECVSVETRHPRALCTAIAAWLQAQGVAVLTTVPLPTEHEILTWLGLLHGEPDRPERGVSLSVELHHVEIEWL